MYKEEKELWKIIFIIILITIFALILVFKQTKDESERIIAYAPDMTYTYEPMEEELSEIEKIVLEDYHHITNYN